MKKTLLSILSLMSLTTFSQWQSTPQTFQGTDCISAFGKLFTSQVNFNNLDVSTDECVTFNPSNTGLSSGVHLGLVNGSTLYAFGANNIYQSTTGNNWTLMTSTTPTNEAVKGMAVINGTVLALTNPVSGVASKIYQLNGSSWAVRSSFTNTIFTVIKNLNNTLYAGTTATCVLKSNDAGLTFTNTSNGITPLPSFLDKYIVTMGATSGAIFCSSLSGKVFRSTDAAATWSLVYSIGNGSSSIGISDFYTMTNNTLLTASDSGFVYSTSNGASGSWIKANTGLATTSGNYQINRLALTANYIVASDKNGTVMRRLINQLPLGIQENGVRTISSSVYPNPASGNVTIEAIELQAETNCSVKLRDVLGRELGTYKMMDGRTNIDLQNFSSGIYTYQVYSSNTALSSGKLIVN